MDGCVSHLFVFVTSTNNGINHLEKCQDKMCSELGESGLRQAEASRCFGETKTLSDSVFK